MAGPYGPETGAVDESEKFLQRNPPKCSVAGSY